MPDPFLWQVWARGGGRAVSEGRPASWGSARRGSGGGEKPKSDPAYFRRLLGRPGKEPPQQRPNQYGWDHERQAKPNKTLKTPAQGVTEEARRVGRLSVRGDSDPLPRLDRALGRGHPRPHPLHAGSSPSPTATDVSQTWSRVPRGAAAVMCVPVGDKCRTRRGTLWPLIKCLIHDCVVTGPLRKTHRNGNFFRVRRVSS